MGGDYKNAKSNKDYPGAKTGGTANAVKLYNKSEGRMKIYGSRINGEIWAEEDGLAKDDENVIDITELLSNLKMEVSKDNVRRIMEPLVIEDKGESIYEPNKGTNNRRGAKYAEFLRNNYAVNKEIEERNIGLNVEKSEKRDGQYIEEVPIIGERKGFNRIDFEKLCYLQCGKPEFLFWFGYRYEEAFDKAVKREYGMTFKEAFRMYRQGGFISLRRSHWKMGEYIPSMNKFLSINYLGMSDNGNKENETENKVDKLIEAIKNV